MAEVDVVLKKWGNSLGVILPKTAINEEELKEEQSVHLIIINQSKTLRESFGLIAGKTRLTGQKAKDLARKELYD